MLCEKVWGGSPATEQMANGIESGDFDLLPPNDHGEQLQKVPVDASEENTSEGPQIQHRRELLAKNLGEYRQKKLKRKLPMDAQLLECAQEELAVKKRMFDRMEKMDKQYADTMDRLSKNMEKLTNSIANGFSLLGSVGSAASFPPPGMYHPGGVYAQSSYIPQSSASSPNMLNPVSGSRSTGSDSASPHQDFNPEY